MEENLENREYQETQPEAGWEARPAGLNRGLLLGAVALLIVAGLAFGYGYRQQIAVGHLTAQQTTANSTIDQLQGQLNSVNAKTPMALECLRHSTLCQGRSGIH